MLTVIIWLEICFTNVNDFILPILYYRNNKSIVKIFIPSVTCCHGNLFAFVFDYFYNSFCKYGYNFNDYKFACLKVVLEY